MTRHALGVEWPAMDGHRLAEERSLALHREVARILREEPDRVFEALQRVRAWRRSGAAHPHYLDAWERLLTGPLEDLLAALTDESETARAMRQATPFAGVVGPRERWKIWAEVRTKLESA